VQDSVALKYWIEMYYSHTQENPSIDQEAHHFALCTHVLGYSYTCPPKSRMQEHLQDLVRVLEDWHTDINRLTKEWGARLSETPTLIWNELPAFLCSRYFGSSLHTHVASLGHSAQNQPDSSSKALCSISRTAANSQTTAVLTIWPSRAYEESWEKISTYMKNYRERETEVSHGWVARYELWRHDDDRQKIMDMSITLCAKEILLLLRHSSRITDENGWGVSGLSSIMVLRTLYVCSPAENLFSGSFQSAVIPMDYHKELKSRWASDINYVPGDWYSYKFSFGQDEKCLLFTEEIRTTNSNKQLFGGIMSVSSEYSGRMYTTGTMVSTAIFEIEKEDNLRVRLQAAFQSREPVTVATIHPIQRYVVLCLGRDIKIWRYDDGKFSLRIFDFANASKPNHQSHINSKCPRTTSPTWHSPPAATFFSLRISYPGPGQ
jgi:hypothetical protein